MDVSVKQKSGGTLIRLENTQPDAAHTTTRLLVIDRDRAAAARIVSLLEHEGRFSTPLAQLDGGLGRSASGADRIGGGAVAEDAEVAIEHETRCTVIDALSTLRGMDLSQVDVAICSTSLRDASGLEALEYLSQARPELPVIMTGADAGRGVEAIKAGASDFVFTDGSRDVRSLPLAVEKAMAHQRVRLENERLQQELKRSLAELSSTNEQLQTVIAQLEMMARTDELTSLSNRRWFNLMLEGHWAEATRHDLPLACMMIDLDGFKNVNDKLGHQRGDDLLRLAAKVIRANCRGVDLPARYGGDEFCVLMGHTEPHEAAAVAKRMLREFAYASQQFQKDEVLSTPLGMSIGIAHINLSRPVNADQLVTHADEAMYAAKFAGKNRVMVRGKASMCSPM